MSKKIIWFVAANPQSFKNVELLSEKLCKNNGYDSVLLNLESIYKQNVKQPVSIKKSINIYIKMKKSFYLYGFMMKGYFLYRFRKVIGKISQHPHVIILGDIGAVEYMIVNKFKPEKVILLQDSLLLWPEKSNWKNIFRNIFYGFRSRLIICDKIVCSGEVSREVLIRNGAVPQKVYPIGIPRFSEDFKVNHLKRGENKLIIGEAYKWHGKYELDNKQKVFLNALDNNKSNLVFRKHPRDYEDYSFKFIDIVDGKDVPLINSIEGSNLIINFAVPSTVIFELSYLQIPTLVVLDPEINYKQMMYFELFMDCFYCVNLNQLDEVDFSAVPPPNNDKLSKFLTCGYTLKENVENIINIL